MAYRRVDSTPPPCRALTDTGFWPSFWIFVLNGLQVSWRVPVRVLWPLMQHGDYYLRSLLPRESHDPSMHWHKMIVYSSFHSNLKLCGSPVNTGSRNLYSSVWPPELVFNFFLHLLRSRRSFTSLLWLLKTRMIVQISIQWMHFKVCKAWIPRSTFVTNDCASKTQY